MSPAAQGEVTVGYADAGTGTATAGAAGAAGADYVTIAPGTLTFAAGQTASTGAVTVTANDNSATRICMKPSFYFIVPMVRPSSMEWKT